MKQGALAGTLKELGYTEDHVRPNLFMHSADMLIFDHRIPGIQILDGG